MHLDGADRLHGIIFFSRDSQNSCSAGRMKRSRSFERSLERNPTFGSLQPFLQQSVTSGPAEVDPVLRAPLPQSPVLGLVRKIVPPFEGAPPHVRLLRARAQGPKVRRLAAGISVPRQIGSGFEASVGLGPTDSRLRGVTRAVVGLGKPIEQFRRLKEPPLIRRNEGAHAVGGGAASRN